MAAFIVGMHFRRVTNKTYLKLLLPLSQCNKDGRRFKYYVLLPEVPRDTAETNPLLKDSYLTDFKSLSRDNCINAVAKLTLEYEARVCKLENDLQDGSQDKTFSALLDPVEQVSSPLEFAWSTLFTLNKVDSSLNLNSAADKLQRLIQCAKQRSFMSMPIYHAFKEVNADSDRLTLAQQQLVNRRLNVSQLCGILLSDSDKDFHHKTSLKLDKQRAAYRDRVEQQTKMFSHILVSTPEETSKFPEELLRLSARHGTRPEEGPWIITLYPPVYNLFMEYCSDRMQRWNVWRANVNRASLGTTHSNSICIEEIRHERRVIAKILGYSSYAEMSLQSKMAGSVSNVRAVLKTLHEKSKPFIEDELLKLQEFALQKNHNDELEPWDIPYWRRVYRDHVYPLDEQEVGQYFQLPTVLNNLFAFCKKIFGVTIKESSKPVNFWSEDVQFYEVFDENGERLGCFCTDLYSRPGQKAHIQAFVPARSRNTAAGMEPLAYLILNFPRPISNNMPTVLYFRDVISIFKKFGHLLHHILSKCPYSEVSGLNNLEWDVVATSSHFLTYFLYHYDTFSKIFKHGTTGQAMPKEMYQNLMKRHRHMAAFDLNQELYLSVMDMDFYSKGDFWMDIMKTLWAEFMPFKLEKINNHPCSFEEIFCGPMAASYYSDIWSEMLAADMFSAFLEAGLKNEDELCSLGRRFKETFLAVGSGSPSTESFRQFRGRDPSIEALLDAYGMKQTKQKPDFLHATE